MKNYRVGVIEKYNSIIHGIPNQDLFRSNGSIRLANQYIVVDEWCSNSYAQNKLSSCQNSNNQIPIEKNELSEFIFENSDSYFDWNDYNDLSNQNILYNNLNFTLNRKYILALFQIFYIPSSIENNENEFYSLAIDKTHLIVKLQRQWRKYQLKINKIKQNLPAYLNKRSIGLNDNSYTRCKKSKI